MSRNDTYLSLCLEQASLSPLHYRHGCVVVRGGKVIGKGYNDYNSGYNGGARSTGSLNSALASRSIAFLKNAKPDHPPRTKLPEKSSIHNRSAKVKVASNGRNREAGTHRASMATTSFSMHAEMMAIHSALSLSSAIASQGTARSTQCLKHTPMPSMPPVKSTPPRRSAAASLPFNSLVLNPLHSRPLQHNREDKYNAEEDQEKTEVSKRQNTYHTYVHHRNQINYLSLQKANSDPPPRQLTKHNNEKHHDQYLDGVQNHRHSNHKKQHPMGHTQRQHNSSALVIPQNRISSRSHQVAERIKDSRLNGADLYVARLARPGKPDDYGCGCKNESLEVIGNAEAAGEGCEPSAADRPASAEMQPRIKSLHDELLYPTPRKPSTPAPKTIAPGQLLSATASRPCYRCVSYMHSAGIKRVFWTNVHGGWECGKVRDMVDALEGPMSSRSDGSAETSGASSVYVTKSEVLILKGLR
ncbi:MAG: hypothetical protein LQ338_003386 [Usnochroma carphineum]|nr:MAG: hypothetical protein LQ338_003386 [Usnochroma carphineum]